MRKLPGLMVTVTAVMVLTGVNPAAATPPTGQLSSQEHGRVQQMSDSRVSIPGSRDTVAGTYTVAPGGDTGWRTASGDIVIAVTKGTLAVQHGDDCAGHDLAAGQAATIPAGKFHLRNGGSEPVEFLGTFVNLPVGGSSPLVDGSGDPGPACAGIATAVVPGGVSAGETARGTTPAYTIHPAEHEGHAGHMDDGHMDHGHMGHGGDSSGTTEFQLLGGKDMYDVTLTLQPGFSTGWMQHGEDLAILLQGTVTYYEGRDGKCAKVEEYHPGQAWAHQTHPHLVRNEGNDPVIVRLVGFNLPHGQPKPVLGSNPDHFDFTPLPPPDCPELR